MVLLAPSDAFHGSQRKLHYVVGDRATLFRIVEVRFRPQTARASTALARNVGPLRHPPAHTTDRPN